MQQGEQLVQRGGIDLNAAKSDQFLQIDRLSKNFDDMAAVDAVSLSIKKGEIFALLGASGCGKASGSSSTVFAGVEMSPLGSIAMPRSATHSTRPKLHSRRSS